MRSSNIELCRIAAILLVVLTHSASWTQGDFSSLDACNVPSLFMRGFAVIGVNVFVFISGWFGINYKRSSLVNLLFIVFFWGIVRSLALYYQGVIQWRNLFVISDTNWFILSYLGLLLFSPIINNYCENAQKKSLVFFLVLFFFYQSWFGWFPALPLFDTFQNGYSFPSFIFIYMTARYLKRFGAPPVLMRFGGLIYISISLILGITAYLAVRYHIPIVGFLYKYNNPLVVLSAIAFFMFFLRIQMPNIKWVNYIASSSLSVLLIHEPYPAHGIIKQHFLWIRDTLMGGGKMLLYWLLSVFLIYFACVVMDQARLLLYIPIKKLINNKKKNGD